MSRIQELIKTYERLYQELENDNYDVEEEVYELEREVNEELEMQEDINYDSTEARQLASLKKKIATMKREFNFYDEEAELDRMFPNRHDDDFDEDSMSYDSVFGDD